jgi:SAM-dependent methyltransferase
MDTAIVQEFFNTWSIYDRVLDRNYMFHNELYQDVQRLLVHRYAERPFSLLDLGCGSARHLAPAIADTAIERYVGFDISDIAITQATRNLSSLNCSLELHQCDLLEGLHQLSSEKLNLEKFDTIFSSFALHHLSSTDKATFFKLTHQLLREDGVLILIDTIREEEESLDVYLDKYCGWIKSEWKAIPPEEIEAIFEHIRDHDFPETMSTLSRMAEQAGFKKCVTAQHFLWHRILCFEKSAQ